MKQCVMYFYSSFLFFQDYAIKTETDLELHYSSSEDQNKKNVSQLENLGDHVEWWRELCTRLDISDRKLAKLSLDT